VIQNKKGVLVEKKPSLAWVLTDDLTKVLHATARIEPTRELRKLGWDVTLISSGPGGAQEIRGAEVETIPLANVYLIRQLIYHWRVLKFLWPKRDDLDVVLCQQISFMWLLPVKWWRVLTGRKRPFLIMDTRDFNSADGGWRTELRVKFYNFMHTLANRFADGQTVITPKMAELAKVPADKLWGIWPSGVTVEKFASSAHNRTWPTEDEPIRLIYVGRLHPERCLVPLARAINQANQNGMSFHLTLIGRGPDETLLNEIADQSNEKIDVIDAVPHHEIPDYLAEAHIGTTSLPPVNNKKFEASSPIKLFEYLAAGMPIFATRNVCHTNVIDGQPFAFWAADATPGRCFAGTRRHLAGATYVAILRRSCLSVRL
jgi:glycosyltransferase involved in cell wall biosynthesis